MGHKTGTGYLPAVAVLGENWLFHIWAGEIAVKNVVYGGINGIVNVPFRNPFMVEGSGGGNGKIVTAGAIPRTLQ